MLTDGCHVSPPPLLPDIPLSPFLVLTHSWTLLSAAEFHKEDVNAALGLFYREILHAE